MRDGDRLIFWTMWVMDREVPPRHPRVLLWKQEVLLGTELQRRYLEACQFDNAGEPAVVNAFSYRQPLPFYPLRPGSRDWEAAVRVLQYAQEGEDQRTRPDHRAMPGPQWQGPVAGGDFDLYWDARSVAAWPRYGPEKAEIIVKRVWSRAGLEARQAYLAARRARPGGYEGLSYTTVNYLFKTDERRMIVLAVSDYDGDGRRLNLVVDRGWRECEPGSPDDAARAIALRLLNIPAAGEF